MSAPEDWEPDGYVPLHVSGGDGTVISLVDVAKDEWLHHLYEHFRVLGHGVSASTKTGTDGIRFEERWFNDDSGDLVRLRLFNAQEKFYVFLGTRDGGDKRAEAAFRDAVRHATESTGNRREDVAWEATVCHVPARRGLQALGARLGAPIEADDVRIESWGSHHSTEVPAWIPGMGFQRTTWHFWPIKVTGSVRCYAWDKDGIETASARLRVVVEVLTLAFDWPVEVRVGPYEASITIGGEEGNVVPGSPHRWSPRTTRGTPTKRSTCLAGYPRRSTN